MLESFCAWLEDTPLSIAIQTADWVIPLVQIIHILGLAAVLSSVTMVNLRLMGVGTCQVSIANTARRFLPWIWTGVVVMALTGAVLTIGEPRREILSPVFQIKMLLVASAVLVTLGFQHTLRTNARFWDETPTRQRSARLTAIVTMGLWMAIAVCGRLIAYVIVGG